MSILEVSALRKSYNGTPAVDDVGFSVESGEILGLLGPNGAGKTTTMMIIAGLLEPDAGSVYIDGLTGMDRRRALGIVPQDLAVYEDLTAGENLKFFGGLYGVRGEAFRRRRDLVLELAGLERHINSVVHTFSGGMKRRLNLAIGLLHEPKVLILDEPTVGVDPQSRSHLLGRVRELSKAGTAVLYASHYMDEVQTICDRVAILDHGRVLSIGPLDDLLRRVRASTTLHVSGAGHDLAERLDGLAELRLGNGAANGASRSQTIVINANGSEMNLGRKLTRVLEALDTCGATVRSIESRESNLEQLFLELTGRHLRD